MNYSKYTWYTNTSNINSPDTIHQVLAFGTLKDIWSLKKEVGENRVKELFIQYPKKVYTSSSLNFIKNFVLKINSQINEQNYLKHTPRYTG